jgi:Ca-activated chloride channel homolog
MNLFLKPEYLYLLILAPIIPILFWSAWKRKQKRLTVFAHPKMAPLLVRSPAPGVYVLRVLVLSWAWIFLVLALARPQWGAKIEMVRREGIDILLLQDISRSMLAQDISPNRLTRSKHEISSFLEGLTGDRVGLIAFAGEARVLTPLTSDYSAVRIFLDVLHPDLLLQGTNVEEALQLGLQVFAGGDPRHQVMVLITDGESHDGDVEGLARQAAISGIPVYTVGVGSREGSPVLLPNGRYLQDRRGNLVTTRLDEETLKKVASITGGRYYYASPGTFELNRILREISQLQKRELESEQLEQFQERYQIPLLIAIILLVLEALLFDRRLRPTHKENAV